MGQAKNRGSFEERKALAEQLQKMKDANRPQPVRRRRSRQQNSMFTLMMAAAVIGGGGLL